MLVRIVQNAVGCIIITPISKRIQARYSKYMLRVSGYADKSVFLQCEQDIEHFMKTLTLQQRKLVREGAFLTIVMSAWDFGSLMGYDAAENVKP